MPRLLNLIHFPKLLYIHVRDGQNLGCRVVKGKLALVLTGLLRVKVCHQFG